MYVAQFTILNTVQAVGYLLNLMIHYQLFEPKSFEQHLSSVLHLEGQSIRQK